MNRLSKPRIYETLLFIALLSGPPRLRVRDPLASFAGEVDWSILLNIAIWGLGAFWVFHQFNAYKLNYKPLPSLNVIQKLALLFVVSLSLSTLVSPIPLLTAYRVFQILIMVLFGFFWVNRFGSELTIKHLSVGYAVLGLAIGASALFTPQLVFAGNRLRGDLIANAGGVAVMGLIAFLSYPTLKNRAVYIFLLLLFSAILVLSLTRSAYIAALFFLLLAIIRRPVNTPLRRSIYLVLSLIPVALIFQWFPIIVSWIIRDPASLATMSDRIPLWQVALEETFNSSPWLGLGFYANRVVLMSYNPGLGTAHSAFVEVLSGGGLVAFLPFIIMFVLLLFSMTKLFILYGKRPVIFTVVGLLCSALITGLVSEEMVVASPASFTFWMLVSLIPMITKKLQLGFKESRINYESSLRTQPLSAIRR